MERAGSLGIARASENIVILYNPPGSEVPVIKLVAMDRYGRKIQQRTESMVSFGTNKNSGSLRAMSLGSSASSDEGDNSGHFP